LRWRGLVCALAQLTKAGGLTQQLFQPLLLGHLAGTGLAGYRHGLPGAGNLAAAAVAVAAAVARKRRKNAANHHDLGRAQWPPDKDLYRIHKRDKALQCGRIHAILRWLPRLLSL
jgi:hypothetical protein